MEELFLPQNIKDKLIEYAREGKPLEVCGILSGNGNQIRKLYKMENTDKSRVSYFMEPQEQFKVVKKIRSDKHQMLAIFHSHPFSPAYPSQTDLNMAFYPDCVYIIVSLAKKKSEVKGFRISNRKVVEVSIQS